MRERVEFASYVVIGYRSAAPPLLGDSTGHECFACQGGHRIGIDCSADLAPDGGSPFERGSVLGALELDEFNDDDGSGQSEAQQKDDDVLPRSRREYPRAKRAK